MMQAKIVIKDLCIQGIVGVHEWERTTKQTIMVNLVVSIDALKGFESDNIADTLNYHNLYDQVIEFVEASCYHLIEKLANSIADLVLSHDSVSYVQVQVDKPGALPLAKYPGVIVEKSRKT